MAMTLDQLFDIWQKENTEGSQLISASIVVKDGNSGEVRVYNSNQYGGVDEYYDYQV